MLITTLCYIEHKNHYLMMHRTKKKSDVNEGKWIGVGGKFQEMESPEECLQREVLEETGYKLKSWKFRGLITFIQLHPGYAPEEPCETEYMCLFTADDFSLPDGVSVRKHPVFASDDSSSWPVPDCDEGELAWIKKDEIENLSLWEGDRIFMRMLAEDAPFFTMKLLYDGDELIESTAG